MATLTGFFIKELRDSGRGKTAGRPEGGQV
jgi:hypothetical protein